MIRATNRHGALRSSLGTLVLTFAAAPVVAQGSARLLGWNDLGMHCMDGDTSVFSILPPFNTFHAQLMVGGVVVQGGYTVSYQAVADPSGSINSTSIGKTDFWQHAQALFGATLQLDEGLRGFRMPGLLNTPQDMPFHPGLADFVAEGVPVTPYDDSGAMKPYPLMRLVARNATGQPIATTDIVVPVSAEMACLSCHASGGNPDARPPGGWVHGPAATDDRLNILKLHDARHRGTALYASSLQGAGYSALGLLDTATAQNTPVLCAACHGSIALGAAGQPGVSALTSAMHTLHGRARLADGRRLDDVADRASCYTCHPGAATRCLRGAMGKAIGSDGNAMMACQDCHGSMSEVGSPARTGWLHEPACQNCHTGDAVANAGAIRFANAFDAPGHLRTTTNDRFATTPDAPQAGLSLYRFSVGHGNLECSACHGSPHAIWPSAENNDNVQSVAFQGHKGTIAECGSCHGVGQRAYAGPHGMHQVGQSWIDHHPDATRALGLPACLACHGADGRGSVLSRAQGDRTLTSTFGARTFWRGYQIGCYECHNGPNTNVAIANAPPVVADRTEATPTDQPLALVLSATDPNADALTLRIVEQPRHGAVAFDGTNATYRAWDGYVGVDSFTYAASDNKRNSNLGTVAIAIGPRACAGTAATFGYGCAAPDGSVPALAVAGCPSPGHTVSLDVTNGPTTGWAIVVVGFGRGGFELGADGCAVRIGTVLAPTPLLALTNGGASHPLAVPPASPAFDATMQAFCLSAAAPRGFVASPGLEVRFR